jgi:hypothetical protein
MLMGGNDSEDAGNIIGRSEGISIRKTKDESNVNGDAGNITGRSDGMLIRKTEDEKNVNGRD